MDGAGNALSDQGGAYLVHLFAKIHRAGHLRCVRYVFMCTYICICTHTYIYTHKYKYLKFISIYTATYIKLYT